MADLGPFNGDYSTISTAVQNASDGDRIIINAGQWTWASKLTYSKNISLIGAGMDPTSLIPRASVATIISGGDATGTIKATYSQTNPNTTNRISGIVFAITSAPSGAVVQLLGTRYMFVSPSDMTTVLGGSRVDHCRWTVPSEPWTTVTAASNGANVSTLTTLNVNSTTNFATTGSIAVQTGENTKTTINYTGITPTSFTGCSSTGTATLATGYVATLTTFTIGNNTFFLNQGSLNGAPPDYITGSIDHNFVDLSPFCAGSECISINAQGNPTGTSPTNQYGQWSWNQPYKFGAGLVTNGSFDATYVEDNIIHKSLGCFDCDGGGGSIIYRNNTCWAHLQEHGMESGNNMGPRGVETLYNLIDNNRCIPHQAGVFFPNRGGGNVLYGNCCIGFPSGLTASPYQVEPYRATSQSSLLGPADGKNWFDSNQTGTFTMNGISWVPVASGVTNGTASTGDIYVRSLAAANPSTFVKALTTFNLTSSEVSLNQTADAYAGFVLINLATAGPNGSQYLGQNDLFTGSYSLITGSTGLGGGAVQVTCQGLVNTPYNLCKQTTVAAGSTNVNVSSFTGAGVLNVVSTNSFTTSGSLLIATSNGNQTVTYTGKTGATFTGCNSSGSGVMTTGGTVTATGQQWEMRRVAQYFCAPGAYSTPDYVVGNNVNSIPAHYADGTVGGKAQQVFGIWQKDNTMRTNSGTAWQATPSLTTLPYWIIIPGGVHDGALPGAGAVGVPAGGYPSTNTGTTHRVGADWEAPGGFAEAIPAGSVDAPTFTVGPPYPGPLVAGSVGAGVTPPAITSSLTSTATVGSAYTYTITASQSPTSYGASGLPGGLSVNTVTGVISGTPPGQPGVYSITISATNAGGTGSAILVLTVSGTTVKGRLPHIGKRALLSRRRLF